MSKRIFITGGAGCLGTSIIDKYLPLGYNFLVLDNFATGKKQNLPVHSSLKLVEGSVADTKLINELVKEFNPELIINSAAAYKDPLNWAEDTTTNILGSINVAKAAAEFGVKK